MKYTRLLFYLILFLAVCGISFYYSNIFVDNDTDELSHWVLHRVLQTCFWLSLGLLVNWVVHHILFEILMRKLVNVEVPKLLQNVTSLIIFFIVLIVIVSQVFKQPLTGIWATSGLLGLVIGFALRDMILDFFAGIAINVDATYVVGDWIHVDHTSPGGIVGKIVDINWRSTKLLTEPNNIVVIPNSVLSQRIITNYWAPNRVSRFEDEFYLDFTLPIDRAKKIIYAGLMGASQKHGFTLEKKPNVIVVKTNEFGIGYRVHYWIKPWIGVVPNIAKDIVHSEILDHLRKAGISMAYPKSDIYYETMPERSLDASSDSDLQQLLSNIDLFSHLKEETIIWLTKQLIHLEFAEGENLIKAGDVGDSMFILLEGLLEVTGSIEHEGESFTTRFGILRPGDFFGEMSLLTGEERSASVTALVVSSVYEIKKEAMEELFKGNLDLAKDISTIIAERTMANDQSMSNITKADMDLAKSGMADKIFQNIKVFFGDIFKGNK